MVLTLTLPLPEGCKIRCYPSDRIPAIWPVAKPFIKKALDRGSNYTLEEVFEGLCDKKMQLWMSEYAAALVTSIQTDKRNKFCLLITLGGERMSDWFQYLPMVENWAKDQGAKEMRLYGRPGWKRLTGYTIEYCKMVKKL